MSFTKLYSPLLLGTWLCAAAAAAEMEALQTTHQGATVFLNDLWTWQRDLPAVPLAISGARGPQFLLSDKPEYFYAGNGIALQERVKPGIVRLYIYHVPQPDAGPKSISAVIQNLSGKPMQLRFLRYAFPKPGKDYHKIGKAGLIDFFNSKPEMSGRSIAANARAVLDPRLDAATVATDELAHGFYEFEIDQPARVTVFQRDSGQSSLAVIDTLPKLPRDIPGRNANGAGRGFFTNSDFAVTGRDGFVINTTNGPMRLVLADGRSDPYILGHDSLAQLDSVRDSGNYGVIYRIHLKWRSDDGRGLALLMTRSVRSGGFCRSQAGAVQVNGGVWPGGTVAVPSDKVSYGDPGEMVVIQKFPAPPKGKTGDIEITYSPPGASCIPTPMLLSPY